MSFISILINHKIKPLRSLLFKLIGQFRFSKTAKLQKEIFVIKNELRLNNLLLKKLKRNQQKTQIYIKR